MTNVEVILRDRAGQYHFRSAVIATSMESRDPTDYGFTADHEVVAVFHRMSSIAAYVGGKRVR